MNRLLTSSMIIVDQYDDPSQDLEVTVDVGARGLTFSVTQSTNTIWFEESTVLSLLEVIKRFKEEHKDYA